MKNKRKTLLIFINLIMLIFLGACSTNKTNANIHEVQPGTVLAVSRLVIPPRQHNLYENIGVSVGSGGHAGIYGAMDLATIGKLLSGTNNPKSVLEIIVRRDNGVLVAVTQPATTVQFKRGDRVKILQQKGEARVIH